MICIINEKGYLCKKATVEYRTGEIVDYVKEDTDILYINPSEIKSISIKE